MRTNHLLLGALALGMAAGLASCGGPSPSTTDPVTLPASPEARDSVKASITTAVPDAASTATDSTRTSVTPR